jgi:5'-deoxynucleotidase YfbR-like HD superfamily hydrolase
MYRMAVACLLLANHGAAGLAAEEAGSALPLASSSSLDVSRAALLALVHDLPEAIVGDIVPHDPMGKEEKARREAAAMAEIQETLGGGRSPRDGGSGTSPAAAAAAELLGRLYHEYEERRTPESVLVKDLDLLDMQLQAYEYELAWRTPAALGLSSSSSTPPSPSAGPPGVDGGGGGGGGAADLSVFHESVRGRFKTEAVRSWSDEVARRREAAVREGRIVLGGGGGQGQRRLRLNNDEPSDARNRRRLGLAFIGGALACAVLVSRLSRRA